MWKIWIEELYKITSRKVIWLGLFILAAFVGLRLWSEYGSYSIVEDGQRLYGREAVAKDKEVAARYAGPFTEETVRRIYDTYGFAYYEGEEEAWTGNFCSRFMTERMTNLRQTDEDDLSQIHFYEGQEWDQNAAPLLRGDLRFDYVYGWTDLKEMYLVAVTALSVLLLIGLSPVFAQEYTWKTAGILLTTRRGKQSGIWMKAAAALFFAAALYVLLTLYVWGIYLLAYGPQGLDASAVFLGVPPAGYCPSTVFGFLLFLFGLGLVGIFGLTGMVLVVSAYCRTAFLAVIVSLALFFVPYAWMNGLSPLLAAILGMDLIKAISHVMVSMPFYLPWNWGFAFDGQQIAMHLAIAAAMGAAGAAAGYGRYRGYQG